MVTVTVATSHDVTILRCSGRIVVDEATEELKEAVICLMKQRAVVLDLTNVTAVDAGGLGLLVSLQFWSYLLGNDLMLMNPAKQVRELLQLTNLESVLPICALGEPKPTAFGQTGVACDWTVG